MVTVVAAAMSLLERADAVGPGTGTIIYNDGSTNQPWVRDWDGSTWSAAGSSATIHEGRVLAGAASRTRDEMIMLGVDIHNNIRGQMWDGGTWAEFPFGTLASVNENFWWSQDVAYERVSGDAVMVWANGSSGSLAISFRVWNGTSWTGESAITTPVAGTVRQLRLAPSPDSDEMVLVVSDAFSRDYALVWNGSSWGDPVVLTASGGTDDRTDIYVAYEQQSGEALVVYGMSASSLHFRTWNGATWSSEQSLAAPAPATGNVRWTTLASDPGSDRIGVGVTTFDGHSWLAVWDGAAWGSALVATQSAPGTIFPSVALGFESDSGRLLALYGEATSMVRYRTWTGAGGWSAQANAFDVGDTPNTIMLDSDPFSNAVMATVQDGSSQLNAASWDGSSWGSVSQLEDNTNEVKNQPFVFLWDAVPPAPDLTGTIYEDVNGDASLSDGVGVAGVSVHLYRDLAPVGIPGSGDTLVTTVTSGPGGSYSFPDVPDGDYWVAVDSITVAASAPLKGGHAVAETWAEQTYAPLGGVRFDGSVWWFHQQPGALYGGLRVMTSDAATSLATREHIARMEIAGGQAAPGLSLTGIDFGFSFNVVTRTGDGDDHSSARTVQGALRQAIANGNALQGTQAPLFRMNAADTGYAGGVWTVVLGTASLDTTDPITLDATTQPGYAGVPLVEVNGAAVSSSDPNCFTIQGGSSTLRGFTINRCGDDGIEIELGGNNVVEANYIGTNAAGTTARANGYGIAVKSNSNRIGGPTAGQGNLISGNTDWGIGIYNAAAGNWVVGNRIGVSSSGGALGNGGSGIEISGGAFANNVGGVGTPDDANVIANNGGAGVRLLSDAGSTNLIRGNSIEGSGGLGIDLGALGVTTNDGGDGDTGPNGLQNFPVVTSAVIQGSDVVVAGTLSSSASATFTIDLYRSSASDPTGYGEGSTYLGSTSVTTNGSGAGSFAVTLPRNGTSAGDRITATATTGSGSTSEFSSYGVVFEGIVLWRTSGDSSPNFRVWDGTVFGPAGTTSAIGEPASIQAAESPIDTEIVMIERTTAGSIVGQIWDGSSWSPLAANPLGSQSIASQWAFAAAYESLSGDPLLVWGDGTGLEFTTRTAGGWSPVAAVSDYAAISGGTTVAGVRLAASPVENEVVLAVTDNLGHDYVFVWSGASWGSGLRVSEAATGRNTTSDVAYEGLSGRAMVVYEDSSTPVHYRLWNGGTWSLPTKIEPPVGATTFPNYLRLASDPNSNAMVLAVSPTGTAGSVRPWVNAWNGTAWGTSVQVTAAGVDQLMPGIDVAFEGTSGQAIAAYGVTGSAVLHYRTWDPVGGWSGDLSGPAIGAAARVVALSADPGTDRVMATEQDGARDLYTAQWSGSAWGSATAIETDTGETNSQPFAFLWDEGSGVPQNAPVFDQDLPNRTDSEGAVISLPAPATDADGDPLTWSATGLPSGLSIDPASGVISGTILPGAGGGSPYPTVIRVEDPGGLFDTDPFTWTVPVSVEYRDNFTTVAFNNSDGTVSWTGSPWQEIGESDGPAAGGVMFQATRCTMGSCLWFDDDYPGTVIGARRSADLTGAAAATLTFDYQFEQDFATTATEFYLDAAPTPTGPWTRLATYVIDTTHVAPQSAEFDVTGFISTSTTVRIQSNGADTDNEIYIDNFQIDIVPTIFDTDTADRSDPEGATISFPATATDPLGETLTYSATGLPPGVTYGASTGVVSGTIDPTARAGSPYSVTLIATDPHGNPHTDTFTWTVTDVNRAPVVTNPGGRSSAEGDPVTFAMLGSDPDGDGVTWTASGLPGGLSIDPVSGVISGTISFDAAGTYVVSVRATDDGSPVLFGEVSFSWSVSNTNRAPVVTDPGAQSHAEGDVVSLPVVGTDPDLDGITWSASELPAGLSIDPSSGVVSGLVSFDASGTHVVTVRATDDGSPVLNGEVVFSWSVSNTNRAPVVANPGGRSNAEGDPVTFAMVGSDPDSDTLMWSASGLPAGLSIDPASGVISGSISFDAAPGSSYLVTVQATDGGSPVLFGEVVFSWSVSNTNRAPVVTNPGNRSGAEGDPVTLAMTGSDPDGNGITWSASGLPSGLSIDPSSGVVSGTASFVAAGTHVVTVRATDGGSPVLFGEVVFSWSVSNTNRAPVVSDPGAQADAEGEVVAVVVAGSDPDGNGVAWSASGLPAGLSIDPATGVISGTVSFDAAAGSPYAVVVRATDDGSPVLFGEAAFVWSVSNTNRAPVVIDPGLQSTAEGQSVAFAMVGSDADGDGITWSASGLPAGLSIDPASGVVSGVLSFESAGVLSVVVRGTDPEGAFGEVEFVWVASNVNRAPVLVNPDTQTTPEGGVVSLVVSGSDPDGDTVTFAAQGLPPGLAIDSSSGVISGVLGFDLLERYAVVVTVVDDGSPMLVSQVGFTWVVGEVNRPPVIGRIADRTSEVGEETRIVATGSDPDDDTLVWSASGLPAGVTIGASSGVISGAAQTPGEYGVAVTLTDDGDPSLQVSDSFSWTVVSPPGFPVIAAIESRRDVEDEPLSFTATASHPDGLAITWSATALPSGMVIDPGTGRISGVPATPGTWFTRVTVTDTRDQQATASFIWMVESAENLPPVAADDSVIVGLDEITTGGIAIDAAGNDHDPEGETITVVSVSPPEAGEAEITGGIVVFRPPAGWLGTTTIGYVIEDPAGNQVEGLISVTVMDTLPNRLGTTVIAVGPGPGGIDLDGIGNLGPGAGTEALLGSVFQSLYVLRLPLALLGGAVFWSLLLGGILNLGFVLRGGLPRLVRRTSRHVAVVLAAHGERVDVLTEPDGQVVLTRLTTVERGIDATGRRVFAPDGAEWVEIHTDEGVGWAPGYHLTEETDRAGFAADPEVIDLVEEFVARLRARRDFTDLISNRGLFVAHHAPIVRYPADRLQALMDDPTLTTWKGRNPAYPDFTATFDLAIAASLLDAYDHPQRELTPDQPTTPATVIPVEFTNFHYLSIGADLHGPERLDQTAWIVVITYEAARPHIIGLISEG